MTQPLAYTRCLRCGRLITDPTGQVWCTDCDQAADTELAAMTEEKP